MDFEGKCATVTRMYLRLINPPSGREKEAVTNGMAGHAYGLWLLSLCSDSPCLFQFNALQCESSPKRLWWWDLRECPAEPAAGGTHSPCTDLQSDTAQWVDEHVHCLGLKLEKGHRTGEVFKKKISKSFAFWVQANTTLVFLRCVKCLQIH